MYLSCVVFVFLTIICFDTWATNSEEMGPDSRLRGALEKFDLYHAMKVIVEVLGHFQIMGAPQYAKLFKATFLAAKLETKPLTEGGCDLRVSLENAHFIFKFLVNETTEVALARSAECNATTFLNGDTRDVFCVGVKFQRAYFAKRLICAWVVNLYSGNGTLKKSFPRESVDTILHWKNTTALKFAHNSSTTMKRAPVRDYYDILEKVGEGRRTKVYKCVEKNSGNIFAARIIDVFTFHQKKNLYDEVDIMNELSHPTSHPNLLTLHEVFDNDDEFVMIVDLLGIDLGELRLKFSYGPLKRVKDYVRQICEGLKHMHARNIIHLDINPSNVMLEKNFVEDLALRNETAYETLNNSVKLIDFSVAQKTDNIRVRSVPTHLGFHDHDFSTPESLENRPLGSYTDMWHVGVLTFYLHTGSYPVWGSREANCSEIDRHIKEGNWSFFEKDKENISKEVLHFILHLLVPDIRKRMTAEDCLNHPWIVGELGPAQIVD